MFSTLYLLSVTAGYSSPKSPYSCALSSFWSDNIWASIQLHQGRTTYSLSMGSQVGSHYTSPPTPFSQHSTQAKLFPRPHSNRVPQTERNVRKSEATATEQLNKKIPVYFKFHLNISTIHLQWIPLHLLHLHIPRSVRSITLPNPINTFIKKSRKQTGWLRSWADGNWGSSPSSYLPCFYHHSNTGPLVGRSCTSSGGARSQSQGAALLSPSQDLRDIAAAPNSFGWWVSFLYNGYFSQTQQQNRWDLPVGWTCTRSSQLMVGDLEISSGISPAKFRCNYEEAWVSAERITI